MSTEIPMAEKIYAVYVVVFRQDPDFQWTRQVGLWFMPVDGGDDHHYFHAKGGAGGFFFEARYAWNPFLSLSFAGSAKVAELRRKISAENLKEAMRAVPMLDIDGQSNCQTWVVQALELLARRGYLTVEESTQGADAMFDLTLEAAGERF